MGELEDCMDDFETKSVQKTIQVPEQFDDVVDIVVSESRAKATEKYEKEEAERESQRPQSPM